MTFKLVPSGDKAQPKGRFAIFTHQHPMEFCSLPGQAVTCVMTLPGRMHVDPREVLICLRVEPSIADIESLVEYLKAWKP